MPDQFWALTFTEFYIMAQGYVKRFKHRRNELLFTAWHTAAFTRAKQLPSLASMIEQEGHKKEQTDDEMFAMARMLNAMFGGTEEVEDGNQI